MLSRPSMLYWLCLCSHDVSKMDINASLHTKLHIYKTLVLSVLLYAADTWTLADMTTLDAFHQKCLRQLLGIRWYDRVRNDEVL